MPRKSMMLPIQFILLYSLAAQSGIYIHEEHNPRFRKRLHKATKHVPEKRADKIVLNIDLWVVKV
jgi:hypothetical protein